jgi:hypothetical protein
VLDFSWEPIFGAGAEDHSPVGEARDDEMDVPDLLSFADDGLTSFSGLRGIPQEFVQRWRFSWSNRAS